MRRLTPCINLTTYTPRSNMRRHDPTVKAQEIDQMPLIISYGEAEAGLHCGLFFLCAGEGEVLQDSAFVCSNI
jgi:hypothetical protein